MITVAIVDDDKYVREGLADHVRRLSDEFQVLGTFGSTARLLGCEMSAPVDVVMLDVIFGPGQQLDENVRALRPLGARILAVTVDTGRSEIAHVLRRHHISVVCKEDLTDDVLRSVLLLVARGGRHVDPRVQGQLDAALKMPRLTRRQDEVLRLIVTGMPPKIVAQTLHLTQAVVYQYLEDMERRFVEAGFPLRRDGESTRKRAWELSRKAIEIGYPIDDHR
ncbi:hypothetical protein [Micromonospora wenchangensis]|uniref:hypothetical protein n=1 Tax=Micromonospora wenchangensis TaxID=1185415 RepID=UPI003820F20C